LRRLNALRIDINSYAMSAVFRCRDDDSTIAAERS
jgi:hypothetical protein